MMWPPPCWAASTPVAPIFHELAERIGRRAIVVILSDLFDDVEPLLAGIKHLRHKRHEVVVFHILDAAEAEFPFQETTLFRGLEQWGELLTDPRSLRQGYLDELNAFHRELQHGCREQNIDYVPLRTDMNLGVALSAYLGNRLARTK